MTQRNYLQHGSRHRATGSDPIPDLGGGLSWAYLSPGASATVTSGGGTKMCAGTAFFYTNNSSVFSQSHVTVGGVDYPGISMDAAGHYLVEGMLAPDSAIPDGYGYGIQPHGSSDGDESTFYSVPNFRLVPTGENSVLGAHSRADQAQIIRWRNILTLGDGVGPPGLFVPEAVNYGAASITVEMWAVIWQLDTDVTFID